MGVEILVDGLRFAEVEEATPVAPRPRTATGERVSPRREAFLARMDNWRKVAKGAGGAADSSAAYCAGWAKLYVKLRTSEAPPAEDQADAKIRPLSPLVSVDVLDGWLVESAWRTLGDSNAREALKRLYIQGWPVRELRKFLKGVRGPHVQLVVAKAERDLQEVLDLIGSAQQARASGCK